MSECAQVKVGDVYIYTHWGALRLPYNMANGLVRSRSRWNLGDAEYIARQISEAMAVDKAQPDIIKEPMTDAWTLEVDVGKKTVKDLDTGKSWSFEEFITTKPEPFDHYRGYVECYLNTENRQDMNGEDLIPMHPKCSTATIGDGYDEQPCKSVVAARKIMRTEHPEVINETWTNGAPAIRYFRDDHYVIVATYDKKTKVLRIYKKEGQP
jgi:hypothetical protein